METKPVFLVLPDVMTKFAKDSPVQNGVGAGQDEVVGVSAVDTEDEDIDENADDDTNNGGIGSLCDFVCDPLHELGVQMQSIFGDEFMDGEAEEENPSNWQGDSSVPWDICEDHQE